MHTSKELAANATALMKTHRVVAIAVDSNQRFCLELANIKNSAASHKVMLITIEGLEEIMKYGFAARSLFP